MINDQQRQQIEQQVTQHGELLPRIWRELYLGCIAQDFEPIQAIDLVKTFILAQNPNGIRPPSDGGAPEKPKDL